MKTHKIFYICLFSAFFIIGMAIGRIVLQGQSDHQARITEQSATIESSPTTTKILIVGTNTLNPDFEYALLKSAWWVIFDHEDQTFFLMPLYPVIGNQSLAAYQVPHQPIPINTNNLDSLKDLELFAIQGVGWDFVVLIDETALSEVISLTADGSASKPSSLDTPDVWADPNYALNYQEGILTHLCSHPEIITEPEKLFLILDNLDSHIKMTLAKPEIIDFARELSLIEKNENICDFLHQASTAAK